MKASNLESLVTVTKFQLLPSVSMIFFFNFNIILTMFSSLKDINNKNIKQIYIYIRTFGFFSGPSISPV